MITEEQVKALQNALGDKYDVEWEEGDDEACVCIAGNEELGDKELDSEFVAYNGEQWGIAWDFWGTFEQCVAELKRRMEA